MNFFDLSGTSPICSPSIPEHLIKKDEAEEANLFPQFRYYDELKPVPSEDGGYWKDKCIKLEARFTYELQRAKEQVIKLLAENDYLKAEQSRKDLSIDQLKIQLDELQQDKQLLKEVVTPYIDQIMENITKGLIIELGKHPEVLAELKKWIVENQDNKVVAKVQNFLVENTSTSYDTTTLDQQLQKLNDLCKMFQLKEPALVEDLPSTSYMQMAGSGASALVGFAWSGVKMGGSLSYWIFKQLVPVLTFGLSSSLLLNNAWLPVMSILINGARIVYG